MPKIQIPPGSTTHIRSQDNNGFYRSPQFFGFQGGGSLGHGGVRNLNSGLGGDADKSEHTFFQPTVYPNRIPLQTVYNESWAAQKFINMPIDDMFIKGRKFEWEDESMAEEWDRLDSYFSLESSVNQALKAARLYGTGFVVVITNQGPETPLDVGKVRPGDLQALHVFDRFSATVLEWYAAPNLPGFNRPSMYEFTVTARSGIPVTIQAHETRCIRFDGHKSLTVDGWDGSYEQEWGISELIPAIQEILHDAAFLQAVTHLSQEASIPVIKVQDLAASMAGTVTADAPSLEELAMSVNMYKSIWRMMLLDKSNEFERVAVHFAGMADLIDRFAARLAAMAGIPTTRFLGRSPAGLNATGESDMNNYAIHVAAMQERMLRRPLHMLDRILAASERIELPECSFQPLTELSDSDRAAVTKSDAEVIMGAATAGLIDENEARERLSNLELFGELKSWSEEELASMRGPDPIEMMEKEAEIQAKNNPPEKADR